MRLKYAGLNIDKQMELWSGNAVYNDIRDAARYALLWNPVTSLSVYFSKTLFSCQTELQCLYANIDFLDSSNGQRRPKITINVSVKSF